MLCIIILHCSFDLYFVNKDYLFSTNICSHNILLNELNENEFASISLKDVFSEGFSTVLMFHVMYLHYQRDIIK